MSAALRYDWQDAVSRALAISPVASPHAQDDPPDADRRPAIRLDAAGDGPEQANPGPTVRAGGLMLIRRGEDTGGDRILFVRHGARGTWELPGGEIEDGETAEGAVLREVREEIGRQTFGRISLLMRATLDGVDYSTFMAHVSEEFEPTLADGELTEWQWASNTAPPPEPLHPGVGVALARLGMNELDIARGIASGDMTSPQQYENIWLFAMRVTGTGVAYRPELEEWVWRPPELYLNDEFLARINGLPVIIQHPETEALNTKEFSNRVIGSIALPYLDGDEVWAVTRIYDQKAAELMHRMQLSTSPGVIFGYPVNETHKLESGKTLLREGEPSLIDHLAVVQEGVWDLGGSPTGVAIGEPQIAVSELEFSGEHRADSVELNEPNASSFAWQSAVDRALGRGVTIG